MKQRDRIVIVVGILFWYPLAGVTYQFLHYLLGLRRLGFDPYYVEGSTGWVYDPVLHDLTPDARRNVATVSRVLERYGFGDRWAFPADYPGGSASGIPAGRLRRLYADADALLNVTGQHLTDQLLEVRRRIYVETDPVASQIKVALADQPTLDLLDAHDTHFTFGENLGSPDCPLPTDGYDWLPTRQPVVLDLWPPDGAAGLRYNTVATWQNPAWKDLVWGGETYHWSKDREFLKILDLPRRTNASFELALRVPADVEAMLTEHGWAIARSQDISSDASAYRRYISGARGEFTVAKDQNVRLNSGWFSDRSACYLSAGRPVITQATGFGNVLPTGCGLYGWRTMDDILSAVDAIEGDYEANRRAAGEIAQEYFRAETVLSSLIERAGL